MTWIGFFFCQPFIWNRKITSSHPPFLLGNKRVVLWKGGEGENVQSWQIKICNFPFSTSRVWNVCMCLRVWARGRREGGRTGVSLFWSRRAGWRDIQLNGVDPSVKGTWLVAVVRCRCVESRPLAAAKLSSISSGVAQLGWVLQHRGR